MTENDSFAELMNRVRAGDELAATELVRRFEGDVRRDVRRHLSPQLGRVLDSMDICQSVLANFFIRAAAGEFDLNDPAQLKRLLVKMARNRLIDHARRPANRLPAGDDSLALDRIEGREEPPAQAVSYRELLQKVRERMTEDERHLADQRALGRSWGEIAAELNDSPERLRKKLERANDRAAEQVGLDRLRPD